MNESQPIEDVSDTALWVVEYWANKVRRYEIAGSVTHTIPFAQPMVRHFCFMIFFFFLIIYA